MTNSYRQRSIELINSPYSSSTTKKYLHLSIFHKNTIHSKYYLPLYFSFHLKCRCTSHACDIKTKSRRENIFVFEQRWVRKKVWSASLSLKNSVAQDWRCSIHPFTSPCRIIFLSSQPSFELRINSMEHSLSIGQYINVAAFLWLIATLSSSNNHVHFQQSTSLSVMT